MLWVLTAFAVAYGKGFFSILSVVTDFDQYQFISTLIKGELKGLNLQFVHPLDIFVQLPNQVNWLLDLDFMSSEQLLLFFKQPLGAGVIGFSKQPERFVHLIEGNALRGILHIPFDFKDLALNSWVGSSFLVALKQLLIKMDIQFNQDVNLLRSNKTQKTSKKIKQDEKIVNFLDFRK